MTDSQANGTRIDADTIEVTGVSEGGFIVVEMADHVAEIVAEMRISIEIRMILTRHADFLMNPLYLHPHRLQQLVSGEWQQ